MTWTTTVAIVHPAETDPVRLRSALHREGWRVITWQHQSAPPAGLRGADILIVVPPLADQMDIAKAGLEAAVGTDTIIFALTQEPAAWAHVVLNPETSQKILADRITALVRLARLEGECRLRRRTLQDLNATVADDKSLKPPPAAHVIHFGGPSPEFSALQATLAENQIELRPVLSASLALDTIESGVADAILLDASAAPHALRELSIILRRNTDLTLSPVLVLDPKRQMPQEMRAPSLVADIIRAKDRPDLVAIRLEQLIRENRRRRRTNALLARTKAKGHFDNRVGLFGTRFFDAHLECHLRESARTGRALSFGILWTAPSGLVLNAAESESLGAQCGGLLARLIRSEDTAAPISVGTMGIIFPSTLEGEAQSAMKRIAAVLSATRFHAPRYIEGVPLDVEWSAMATQDKSSSTELLQTAVRSLARAQNSNRV